MNFLDKFQEFKTLLFKVDHKPIVREITHVSLISVIFILLSGCMGGTKPQELRAHADQIASLSHFNKQLVATQDLKFLTYRKIAGANKEENSDLHIYIEGDGRSYLTPTQVSPDPTPEIPWH